MDIIDRLVTTQRLVYNGDYAPESDESPEYYFGLADLANRKASLVLGEPGIGKSTAMRNLYDSWRESGEAVELLDLRHCTSADSVERSFERLRAPGANPILLLDSVDEAPFLMRHFVIFLRNVLTALIRDGWRVIATCRTAESVAALDALFDDLEADAVHVLLPLRRSDVSAYATDMDIDAEIFQAEISNRRLDSLAAVPYTLQLLCGMYAAEASFPETRSDLFDGAIQLALAHTSVDGYSPVVVRDIPPLRQVATAERLAAFATFAGTTDYAIYEPGAHSDGTQAEELVGPSVVGGRPVPIQFDDLQGVLRTPLFASSGTNQRRFAHRRLQDFLAARFLLHHDLSRHHLESILLVPDGEVIPPQMADVATWLVALDGDAFRWLVELDPISLVRNKIALDVPDLAEHLVGLLLQRAETVERAITWRDELVGLGHRGLPAQLAGVLHDGTDAERMVALLILNDSYVSGLENELASLVADRTATPIVRERTARILMRQGLSDCLDVEDLLTPDFFADDDNAELRGLILRTLWPDAMTPALLTKLLVAPPDHFVGSYSLFLAALSESIPPGYAEVLLMWAASSDVLDRRSWNGRGSLRMLVEHALSSRMNALADGDPIPDDVVTALHTQITSADRRIPVARRTMSEGVRRTLIRALASKLASDRIGWFRLQGIRDADSTALVDREDVPWMLQIALEDIPADEQPFWGELIDRFLDAARSDDMELIWAMRDTPMWRYFSYRFDPIPVNSEQAQRAREHQRTVTEEMSDVDTVDAEAMSAEEYTSGVRDKILQTQDDATRFWELARWLDFDLETRQFGHLVVTDLLSTDVSRLLSEDIRVQVCALAMSFLTEPRSWRLFEFGARQIGRGTLAAYQGLHTLFEHDPSRLDQLTAEHWAHLNLAILEFPSVGDVAYVRQELLRRSYASNSSALSEAVREHLRFVSVGTSVSEYLDGLEEFTDASMTRTLQDGIRNRAGARAGLATLYLATEHDGARAWMRRRVKLSTSDAELATILSVTVRDSVDEGLRLVETLLSDRPETARTSIPLFAQLERLEPVPLTAIPVATRARLYESLAQIFPPGESFPAGVHSVPPSEDLAEWRDALLAGVVREGTRASFTATVAIGERLPGPITAHAVVRAREAYRVAGWFPLTVKEWRAVLDDTGTRLVRSSRDIKVTVMDALAEMAGWLKGETPQAFALWDHRPGFASPKDENRISDWYAHGLRLLLDRSGLVINREVEIVNLTGRGVGRRNDIRVEARDLENGNSYVVVVEVKGIWNRDVKKSLRTQLAGEYLADLGLTHAIYLVVTFPPEQITVQAKANAARSHSRGLRAHLDAEAASFAPALDISAVIHDAAMPT